ncbi:MAG: hypothetical protein M0R74_03060 [Dehalococcoidia bacterium]|jgi:hypothetical protein|nr:hypothetical protein [Dehalococcoidia bacterium]
MSRPPKEKADPEVQKAAMPPTDTPPPAQAPKAQPPKEKYFRVKFHPKSRPEDEDDVTLSVNGEVLVIARQKEVVLPERYIGCAENANYQQFRQMPGMTRKIIGEVHIFPFDKLGEATEEEFKAMRKKGTDATRRIIEDKRIVDDQ